MEVLSSELARSIVDRTMKVVNHNINIMNEQGTIIASGDRSRIGTIHEGAIIALQRKSEFIIDENESEKLKGVLPGINLVIEFKNRVVGVIGVTGEPEEVSQYGKLIKTTAEMMIEQEHIIRGLEWNSRIKEEMMLAFIYNKQDSFILLEGYAKKIGISYDTPTNVFIVELNFEEAFEKRDLDISNRIIRLLEGTFKGSLAAAINGKTIALLHKCLPSNNKTTDYKEKLREVNEKIYDKIGINVKISTGKVADNLYEVHKSFEIANETLLFGKKMFPSDNVYVFDLLKSEMLFSQNSTKWKIDELENTYKLIESNDKNGELRETLEALIEENGELNNVSSKLFIHRNTLSYRLNKIHKLTNKNPRKYTDLFWLYSAMINIPK